MFSKRTILIATAGLAALCLETGVAQAQTTDIGEIVVTARKREERLQDVPAAVSAFTAEALAAARPQNIADLNGRAPNVLMYEIRLAAGGGGFYMRGLGYTSNEKSVAPSVGVTLDDVVYGTNTGALLDSFDVQQIEMNRGPQGLFEGKNTIGGLVKVTRSRPTKEWGGKVSASYGNDNDIILRGLANMPVLGDKGGLKLGVMRRTGDGHFNNLYTGKKVGGVDVTALTGSLLVDFTEDFDGLFIFDYVRDRSQGGPVRMGSAAYSRIFGTPYNVNNLKASETIGDAQDYSHLELKRGSGKLTWRTDAGTFTSITGYIESVDQLFLDIDGGCSTDLQNKGCVGRFAQPANPVIGTLHSDRPQKYQQFTQEVRFDADFSESLKGTFGAYYYMSKIKLDNISNAISGGVYRTTADQTLHEKDTYVSGFGNLQWDVTDTFSLSAGARYLYETKRDANQVYSFVLGRDLLNPPVNLVDDWNKVLTRLDATWKITPYNMVYANRAEGFRSGGFAPRTTLSEQFAGQNNCPSTAPLGTVGCPNQNFAAYDPEVVTTYELGTKNRFMNGRLTVNLAAFYTEDKGLQQQVNVNTLNVDPVTRAPLTSAYGASTNQYFVNVQKTSIKGFEAEVLFAPPQIPGFDLSLTYGYQDAKVKEALIDARKLGVGPGGRAGSGGVVDVTATTFLLYAPKYNYAITGSQRLPIGEGELKLNGTWRYQDDIVMASLANQPVIQKGYGLLEASATYEQGRYTVTVYGKNLLNKEYIAHTTPSVFMEVWGTPRTFAIELAAQF